MEDISGGESPTKEGTQLKIQLHGARIYTYDHHNNLALKTITQIELTLIIWLLSFLKKRILMTYPLKNINLFINSIQFCTLYQWFWRYGRSSKPLRISSALGVMYITSWLYTSMSRVMMFHILSFETLELKIWKKNRYRR